MIYSMKFKWKNDEKSLKFNFLIVLIGFGSLQLKNMGFGVEFYWNWIVKMNKFNSKWFIQWNSSEKTMKSCWNWIISIVWWEFVVLKWRIWIFVLNSIEIELLKWINSIQSDLFNSIQVKKRRKVIEIESFRLFDGNL